MNFNKQDTKTPMPERDPKIRNSNFLEVSFGYDEEMAVNEANRCVDCKHKPCIKGCPVKVDIPLFIKQVKNKEFEKAYETIAKNNVLPAVCGRVCPQERQCEAKCIRGIKGESVAIGRLERFVADYNLSQSMVKKTETTKSNGHKVAIVGSGPSGLTCAGELAKLGYEVTVFEALHKVGGVLTYGIPEFRLPEKVVQSEIKKLEDLGVKFKTNMVIGRLLTLDELREKGFDAIFMGSGTGLPSFMNIPGEGLAGVMSANEFLTRINLMKAYNDDYDTPIYKAKNVAVVGGGNVAMDAARSALRLGAESVTIVYRRGEEELPARLEEIHHAKEEGVKFKYLTAPTRVCAGKKGEVDHLQCITMELGDEDYTGRARPIPIEDSDHDIIADLVIVAIGGSPNPLIKLAAADLEVDSRGCIVVDGDTMETSREDVFAAGDAVTGAATVILAMGGGKIAAHSIDQFISSKKQD